MSTRHRIGCWASLLGATAVLATSQGFAGDRAACFDAASKGQSLRDQHKLLEARDAFRICSQRDCPTSMQSDCTGWLNVIEKSIPSVVLSAKDAAGRDVLGATVTLDGQSTFTKLDGTPLSLNPGPHNFRFQGPDGSLVTEQVLLKEGERARSVAVVLSKAAPPPSEALTPVDQPLASPGGKSHTAAWVVGGTGLAAVAAGAVLVVMGASNRSDCNGDGGCTNQGALDQYNRGTPLLNAGYGLLALGAAATVTGAVLWLSSGGSGASNAQRPAVRVGLGPAGLLVSTMFQ